MDIGIWDVLAVMVKAALYAATFAAAGGALFLGYAGTLATSYIDYLIADRSVVPEESRGD